MAHLWRPANKTYLRWIMKTTTRIFTITQYMQVLWNPLACFILLATNSNLCTRGFAELQMFALIRDPACLWGLNCFQHELHSIPQKNIPTALPGSLSWDINGYCQNQILDQERNNSIDRSIDVFVIGANSFVLFALEFQSKVVPWKLRMILYTYMCIYIYIYISIKI